MDYVKEYRSVINSHYLSQGVRITIGVILPAIVLSYFNNLPIGIIVALGAMSVSITDNPGPIHHRRNGMIACTAIIFAVSLLTGLAAASIITVGILIIICCFVFSIIGVYGSRATSIGASALIVMVLNIDRIQGPEQAFVTAGMIAAGGIWYTVLSLLLYSFRPYRLTQQVLGDCIQSTADYLVIKASFYNKKADYERNYQQLLEQQIKLHQEQDLIRELLFKSRNLVKDSTPTSRILLMIFLDIVDLFERIMTSQQDYRLLHSVFDSTDILQEFRQVMLSMANELDELGVAVKSRVPSNDPGFLSAQVKKLKERFIEFRDESRTAENVEGFISLRHILENIEDISTRLHRLHSYTLYDQQQAKAFTTPTDLDQFITHQDFDIDVVLENLTLTSNIFRHAIRVSVATFTGYVVSRFLPFGHGYWVLLTIIVILKPAYSLTKKRNYERLLGTIAGAVIGIAVLYFFQNKSTLLAFLVFFMICTYSLIRVQYLVSVLFMTPYILLLFHLLNPASFRTVVSDRLIDTGIGSAIAFAANFFLLPAWEQTQIVEYMRAMLNDNKLYFDETAARFSNQPLPVNNYKLARKRAFVSLANLSDAFNRMLSEPKKRQSNIRFVHQFVVLNHILTSHIATLAYYTMPNESTSANYDFHDFIEAIASGLSNARAILLSENKIIFPKIASERIRKLNDDIAKLTSDRKLELQKGITESATRMKLSQLKPIADQFNFMFKITEDLQKLCDRMQPEKYAGEANLKPITGSIV